jgi:precorrin-6x reductase
MYAWQAARRARVKERLQPATRLRHNGGSEALSRRQEAHRKALVRRAHPYMLPISGNPARASTPANIDALRLSHDDG